MNAVKLEKNQKFNFGLLGFTALLVLGLVMGRPSLGQEEVEYPPVSYDAKTNNWYRLPPGDKADSKDFSEAFGLPNDSKLKSFFDDRTSSGKGDSSKHDFLGIGHGIIDAIRTELNLHKGPENFEARVSDIIDGLKLEERVKALDESVFGKSSADGKTFKPNKEGILKLLAKIIKAAKEDPNGFVSDDRVEILRRILKDGDGEIMKLLGLLAKAPVKPSPEKPSTPVTPEESTKTDKSEKPAKNSDADTSSDDTTRTANNGTGERYQQPCVLPATGGLNDVGKGLQDVFKSILENMLAQKPQGDPLADAVKAALGQKGAEDNKEAAPATPATPQVASNQPQQQQQDPNALGLPADGKGPQQPQENIDQSIDTPSQLAKYDANAVKNGIRGFSIDADSATASVKKEKSQADQIATDGSEALKRLDKFKNMAQGSLQMLASSNPVARYYGYQQFMKGVRGAAEIEAKSEVAAKNAQIEYETALATAEAAKKEVKMSPEYFLLETAKNAAASVESSIAAINQRISDLTNTKNKAQTPQGQQRYDQAIAARKEELKQEQAKLEAANKDKQAAQSKFEQTMKPGQLEAIAALEKEAKGLQATLATLNKNKAQASEAREELEGSFAMAQVAGQGNNQPAPQAVTTVGDYQSGRGRSRNTSGMGTLMGATNGQNFGSGQERRGVLGTNTPSLPPA